MWSFVQYEVSEPLGRLTQQTALIDPALLSCVVWPVKSVDYLGLSAIAPSPFLCQLPSVSEKLFMYS